MHDSSCINELDKNTNSKVAAGVIVTTDDLGVPL
jgi:hypothetical protein